MEIALIIVAGAFIALATLERKIREGINDEFMARNNRCIERMGKHI